MSRILMISLALLLPGAVVAADDVPKPPKAGAEAKKADAPKETAPTVASIEADLKKAMPDIVKEFRAATTQADRNAALEKLVPFAEHALVVGTNAPDKDEALEAARFVINALGTVPQTPKIKAAVGDALRVLVATQIENPKLAGVLQQLAAAPVAGSDKLFTAATKSTNKNVRGLATYGQAKALLDEAEKIDDPAKAAELETQAEQLFETIATEYATVQGRTGTLGALVAGDLFVLRHLRVGKTPPDIESTLLDGTTTKLSDYRGKVVVLDIWATWCGPCRGMIPHSRELVSRLKDKPFVLVSISADQEKSTLTTFMEKNPMPWTHWFNGPRGGIVEKWQVRYFPTIYVLDAKGVIRYKDVRGEEMDKAVEALLKDTPATPKDAAKPVPGKGV